MPKTIFVDGSILTPTFMDTFFGNTAITGHVHTETNDDGSAPKIDLSAHVKGILPAQHLITSGNVTVEADFGSGFTGGFTLEYKASAGFTNMHFGSIFSGTPSGSPTEIEIQPTGGGTWDSAFFGISAFETGLVRATHGAERTGVTFKFTDISSPIDITMINDGELTWINAMSIAAEQQISFFQSQ